MFDFMMNEKQLALREEIRDFVKWVPRKMILDMDADKIRFPKEFLQEAGRRNLMGCRYPKKLGGRDMDWQTSIMVMEEIGVLGYIFACVFGVGSELVCDAVVLHGTEEQKEKYVKPLLKGEIFSAECLTEPRGGSDFFGTTTKAEDCGDYFLLNGQKRFIVGAEAANFFLVYAKTEFLEDVKPHNALTCFIVDKGKGVSTAYHYGLMGCRGGGAGRVIFNNVEVPKKNIIGKQGQAYKVFNTMMIPERLGTAAMTIGAARPALEIATRYTNKRKAFGKKISSFQGVSFQIAEAAMLLDVSRSICYSAAKAVDSGDNQNKIRRIVSEAKKFTTCACQKAANHSMQVMGGIGYTNIFPIERIVRDLRLSSIWTGTNEIMSMIIANEWYKEHLDDYNKSLQRDFEMDAEQSEMEDEKVYEFTLKE